MIIATSANVSADAGGTEKMTSPYADAQRHQHSGLNFGKPLIHRNVEADERRHRREEQVRVAGRRANQYARPAASAACTTSSHRVPAHAVEHPGRRRIRRRTAIAAREAG